MTIDTDQQTSLYEREVDDEQLVQALEERQALKEKAAKARKDYAEADEWTKGLVAALRVEDDAPVRVGRFLLTRRSVAARSVHFETDPSSRLTISLLPEEDA